jgi:hypothetical protein
MSDEKNVTGYRRSRHLLFVDGRSILSRLSTVALNFSAS